MTKLSLILMVCLFWVAGCASMQTKFRRIEPGQSRAEVVNLMGAPDSFKKADAEKKPVLAWQIDDFTSCHVVLNSDDKVEGKECETDRAAMEAYSRRLAAFYQMQAQQKPSYAPAQAYQPQRQTNTNCTTRFIGGVAQSDCTSKPTGIDSSIYR